MSPLFLDAFPVAFHPSCPQGATHNSQWWLPHGSAEYRRTRIGRDQGAAVPLGTGNDSLLEQSLVSAKNHREDEEKHAEQENRNCDNGNEAPRSKLRGILRNSPKPFHPPSPRLRRVLLAFIPAASYGVFGEGE